VKPTVGTVTLPQKNWQGTVVREVIIRAYLFPNLVVHRPLATYDSYTEETTPATHDTGWTIRHRESAFVVTGSETIRHRDVLAFAAAIEEGTTSWPEPGDNGKWGVNLEPLSRSLLAAAEKLGLVRDRRGGWEYAGGRAHHAYYHAALQ